MENQTVQSLKIGLIKPDPGQPRKSFKVQDISELADSIAKVGLLQPITVRPSGSKFVIVMGERRYRACKMLKWKSIPCMVREIEEDAILEVQIIENLQRKDVEPVEEAEAIAMLKTKFTPEEIANRIGRNKKFVYGRIKLSELIEGFKPFVRSKEMTLSLAVTVASFPPEQQHMILEGMGQEFKERFVQNACNKQAFDLAFAPFKTDDAKLVAKVGACKLCPFNSANQGSLFGDGKQICTKSSCYVTKKTKTLLNLIEEVKKDGRLLIPEFYRHSMDSEDNQLILSIMEENGLETYMMDDMDVLKNPVKPTAESIRNEYHWQEWTDDEVKEELEDRLEDYNEEVEAYTNAPNNGYNKGILIDPKTYHWEEVLLKEEEEAETDVRSLSIKEKKMDDCTPTEKIQKMNSREVRKKELENNKQFEEVVKMVRDSEYHNTKKTLSNDEMVAYCFNIFENQLSWYSQRDFFKGFLGNTEKKSRAEVVEQFRKNFKKEMFHKLIRFVMSRQVHFGERNHTNNFVNISFYTAVRPYLKKDIEA
ncbi:MAG: ParB/RepB/Spo0J family partition protein, partial [Bacteroidota bacterium]